ncbi:MAG: hypothetical protein SWZ49_10190 [Cyanobacteriota bacterium]|nr:hypothetical protein [Cyanobacteriota bacterium]
MKKILKNTIALATLLTLSTITLPAYAQTNLPEVGAEEVLVAQRISRRGSQSTTTRCTTIRRTRRWLYQRCRRTICFRRGRRGRLRCRLVSSWRRRISRRNRRFSRGEIPRTSGRFSRGEIPRSSGRIWRRD